MSSPGSEQWLVQLARAHLTWWSLRGDSPAAVLDGVIELITRDAAAAPELACILAVEGALQRVLYVAGAEASPTGVRGQGRAVVGPLDAQETVAALDRVLTAPVGVTVLMTETGAAALGVLEDLRRVRAVPTDGVPLGRIGGVGEAPAGLRLVISVHAGDHLAALGMRGDSVPAVPGPAVDRRDVPAAAAGGLRVERRQAPTALPGAAGLAQSPVRARPAGRSARRRSLAIAGAAAGCLIVAGLVLGVRLASTSQPAPAAGSHSQAPIRLPRDPHPAYAPAVAFDASHDDALMFGGIEPVARTWLWDSQGWRPIAPASEPSDRFGAAMAYDPLLKQVLLFGGRDGQGRLVNDTWAWDERGWTRLTAPGPGPPAVELAAMAWDDAHQEMVLLTPPPVQAYAGVAPATWTWTGTAWNQLRPQAAPPAVQPTMTFDAATNTVLLALSELGPGGSPSTWSWDGATWHELHPAHAPNLARAYLVHVPGTATLLLASPASVSPKTAETWIWDGRDWSRQTPQLSPSGLVGVVADEVRGTVIAFGGLPNAATVNATWAWNGATWVLRLATVPGTAGAGGGRTSNLE